MKRYYNTKGGGELKDIDVKSMTMTGYFSKFGNIDLDGDMIMPGAFTKTIKERGPEGKNQIWFLQDHNWMLKLSKPKILKADSYGLYYEAKVREDISYAKDMLILAQEGHYKEHSFAFAIPEGKRVKKDGYYEIQEVKMYEGSIVALGANPETPFTGFKNLKTMESKGHFLIKEIEKIDKCLKVSGLTDDTYTTLQMQLLQLKEMMLSFEPKKATQDEPVHSTVDNSSYLLI